MPRVAWAASNRANSCWSSPRCIGAPSTVAARGSEVGVGRTGVGLGGVGGELALGGEGRAQAVRMSEVMSSTPPRRRRNLICGGLYRYGGLRQFAAVGAERSCGSVPDGGCLGGRNGHPFHAGWQVCPEAGQRTVRAPPAKRGPIGRPTRRQLGGGGEEETLRRARASRSRITVGPMSPTPLPSTKT